MKTKQPFILVGCNGKICHCKKAQETKTVLTKDSYKSLGIKLYDIHGNEVNNELPIPEVYTNWEKHYLQTTRTQQITRLDDILKDTVIGQLANKELKTYRGMLDVRVKRLFKRN